MWQIGIQSSKAVRFIHCNRPVEMCCLGLERYWYWVIGYWAIFTDDTQYNTNQTAVSTVYMPVNDYLVPLVTCTLTDAVVCLDTMLMCYCLLNTIIVIIIEFMDFSWSLLCCTLVSVLVLGIGIARGQYYWVLDIGCLSSYRSNPTPLYRRH